MPDQPNVVKLRDDGSIESPCPVFKSSMNICSHFLSVAEKERVLPIYLDWVRRSDRECNLYILSTKNINVTDAGQKGGKEEPGKPRRNPLQLSQ